MFDVQQIKWMSLSFRGTVLRVCPKHLSEPAATNADCTFLKWLFSRLSRIHSNKFSRCILAQFGLARCQHFALLALASRKMGGRLYHAKPTHPTIAIYRPKLGLDVAAERPSKIAKNVSSAHPISYSVVEKWRGKKRDSPATLEITNHFPNTCRQGIMRYAVV